MTTNRQRTPIGDGEIVLRRATGHDAVVLAHLATLDGRPALAGEVLVAEQDGRLVAALSISDGVAVADPFVASASAVELLAHRAGQLARPRDTRRWARLMLARA